MQSIKMRSYWPRVGLKPMTGVLTKKEKFAHREEDASREPHNHRGRDWNANGCGQQPEAKQR